MKRCRVKFINVLDNFPVNYAALFIIGTNDNNYVTLLMVFNDTHDGYWPIKSHPSSG